jgi:hypothetical protein
VKKLSHSGHGSGKLWKLDHGFSHGFQKIDIGVIRNSILAANAPQYTQRGISARLTLL